MLFPVPGAPIDGDFTAGEDLGDCIGFGTGTTACFPSSTTIEIGNIRGECFRAGVIRRRLASS